ncbi:MAG TPA: C45 family peptidase [Planctomycetota bacterium]|nr:C45 family peptidase [Planctomycetota bacterium]
MKRLTRHVLSWLPLCVLFCSHLHAQDLAQPVFYPEDKADGAWTGKLVRINPHLAMLTVRGSAKERGTAHGKLLAKEVAAVTAGVKRHFRGDDHAKVLAGAKVMRRFIDADVLEEHDACAEAAGVDKDDLMLVQLFGDAARGLGVRTFCSIFAAFGPATKDGTLIVGRNFDYTGLGLEDGLPMILQEIPTGENAGRPFVTVVCAGILNGWTAMNADGLVATNNTLFNGKDRLEGMATCFLLRKIVERAKTVEEGVKIIEKTPRACTTGMLVAGKNEKGEWDARFVEFDAESLAVVEPKDGRVLGTNSRQKLPEGSWKPSGNPTCPRYQNLLGKLKDLNAALDFDKPEHNVVAAKGVYMGINLHCALLDPAGQRFRLAVREGGDKPAAEGKFRLFKIERDGVSVISDSEK